MRALVDKITARGAEARLDLGVNLIDVAMARLARNAAGQPPKGEASSGEFAILNALAGTPAKAHVWADLQQELSQRIAHGRAVNIDPASLLTDAFLRIEAAAR